jgi:hypothetical protein
MSLPLPSDIILLIFEYLTNKEKIYYLSSSLALDKSKNKIKYNDKVLAVRMNHLSYANNFTYSFHETYVADIPKIVTHLFFNGMYCQLKQNAIPTTVTHLTFGGILSQSIDNYVPPSVTHLALAGLFNSPIKKKSIPLSVTHLSFGFCFNQSIKNVIPMSVTHVVFGYKFDQPIEDSIPSSVSHLEFGYRFNHLLDNIPESVKEIIIHDIYSKPISEEIKKKIKYFPKYEYMSNK